MSLLDCTLLNYMVLSGTGSSNNYAYLVKDDKTNDAIIIDPANPPEYMQSYQSHGASV